MATNGIAILIGKLAANEREARRLAVERLELTDAMAAASGVGKVESAGVEVTVKNKTKTTTDEAKVKAACAVNDVLRGLLTQIVVRVPDLRKAEKDGIITKRQLGAWVKTETVGHTVAIRLPEDVEAKNGGNGDGGA